jgi:prophage antirepressor-like protein
MVNYYHFLKTLQYKLDFEGSPLNIHTDNGMLWFRAQEIADRLGYANPWEAVQDHVEPCDLAKC